MRNVRNSANIIASWEQHTSIGSDNQNFVKPEGGIEQVRKKEGRSASHDVGALYSVFRKPLLAFFKRRLPTDEDPEDSLQILFKRLVEIKDRTHIDMSEYLIFKIARNMVVDRLRWRARHHVHKMDEITDQNIAEPAPNQEQIFAGKERLLEFCTRLENLPPRCREVFILHRVYGCSHKDVAGKLGISVSTVEKHMIKATEKVNLIMREMS